MQKPHERRANDKPPRSPSGRPLSEPAHQNSQEEQRPKTTPVPTPSLSPFRVIQIHQQSLRMPQSILKLPSEILLDICQRSDLKDINALARCCKYTYTAINPILYRLDARSFSPWALYWSCITGAPRTATLSIAAGSSVSQFCDPRLARSREPNWKQYGYSRPSALDIAIRSDNDELIELLKSHDAKITDWATLDIFIVKGQRQLFTEFLSHLPVSSQIGRRYESLI